MYPARAQALAHSAVEYQAIYSDVDQLLNLVEALAQPAALGALSPLTRRALDRILLTRLRQCSSYEPDVSVRFMIATCKIGCASELLSLLRGKGLVPSSLALCMDALAALSFVNGDGHEHCEGIVEDLRAQTRVLLSTVGTVTTDTNPVRILNLFARAPGGTTSSKSQAFLRYLASQRISPSIAAYVEVDDWIQLVPNLGFIAQGNGSPASHTTLPAYVVRLVLLLVRETYPRLRSLSAEQLLAISSGLWSRPVKYNDDLYSATLVEALLQYKAGLTPQQWALFLRHIQYVHVSLQRRVYTQGRPFIPPELPIPESLVKEPIRPTLSSKVARGRPVLSGCQAVLRPRKNEQCWYDYPRQTCVDDMSVSEH